MNIGPLCSPPDKSGVHLSPPRVYFDQGCDLGLSTSVHQVSTTVHLSSPPPTLRGWTGRQVDRRLNWLDVIDGARPGSFAGLLDVYPAEEVATALRELAACAPFAGEWWVDGLPSELTGRTWLILDFLRDRIRAAMLCADREATR